MGADPPCRSAGDAELPKLRGAMSAKVSKLGLSKLGLRFFSHRADATGCPSAGETLAHWLLKV